ncbi:hypothetical protein ACN28S_58060 [Cystobacter fuscus]
MMNGDALLEQWLLDVRSLPLVTEGSAHVHANENMLIFSASELQDCGVNVRQTSEFLFKIYREYWRKAEARGVAGWFYAWHDELSGTLRCSMAAVERVEELPFGCRLNIADSPDAIARALVESEYNQGIPADELIPVVHWDENEEEPSGEYCLTVFARQIGASSAAPFGQ